MVQWFDNPNPNGTITPYEDLGVFNKINLVLNNIADPTTIPKYEAQSKLSQIANDPSFGQLAPTEQLRQYAAITGDVKPLAQFSSEQVITPYQQAQLGIQNRQLDIQSRRQPNYQFIQNPDGSVSVGNPATGQLAQVTQSPLFNSGLQPGQGTTLPSGKNVTLDESGKPLYGVDPVPGYVPASGFVPTADDTKKVKAATASSNKLLGPNGLLARYDEAVKKYGSEFGGRGEQLLNGLKTDINLELKNVNELGALSGPDQSILDAQLFDPTNANIRGSLSFLPGVTSPTELGLESSKRLRETVVNNVNAGLGAVGYKKTGGGKLNSAGGWSIKPKGK